MVREWSSLNTYQESGLTKELFMKYALIKDNTIVNVIESDELFVSTLGMDYENIDNLSVGIGYIKTSQGTWVLPNNPIIFVQNEGLQSVEALLPKILEKGFLYGSDRIQADPVAQQNATGFLTAVSAGVPVPFPIEWRTKANTSVWIPDLDSFKVFSAMMLQFVQQVFHDTWKAKDDVRSAVTTEEIGSLIEAYKGKYGV